MSSIKRMAKSPSLAVSIAVLIAAFGGSAAADVASTSLSKKDTKKSRRSRRSRRRSRLTSDSQLKVGTSRTVRSAQGRSPTALLAPVISPAEL